MALDIQVLWAHKQLPVIYTILAYTCAYVRLTGTTVEVRRCVCARVRE